MTERIFNFAAGPAVLPLPVLQEAQRDLITLPGVGMSVLEISHRSKTFDEIILGAEADLRKLAVFDGHTAFVMGHGMAKEWLGNGDDGKHWRDTGVRLRGRDTRGAATRNVRRRRRGRRSAA